MLDQLLASYAAPAGRFDELLLHLCELAALNGHLIRVARLQRDVIQLRDVEEHAVHSAQRAV